MADARTLLAGHGTSRAVINRAYYASFYAVLAHFIKTGTDVRTSKHAGVIALFNNEFVHTGRIPAEYSRALQRLFDARQESDFKEFVQNTLEEATAFLALAEGFVATIERFLSV